MTDIYQHLSYIQKHLNAPKNRRNSFGNYNYRNCEDIVEAVKKILPEGCSILLRDEIVLIGDRFYVRAEARLLCKEGSIEAYAFARESYEKKGMDSAQITGSASSYARKYALNGLFSIDDSQDADSHDNTQEPKKTQQAALKPIWDVKEKPLSKPTEQSQFLSKDQVFKLSKLIFDAKIDAKQIYEKYKITGYEQLTNAQAKEIAADCQSKFLTV